MFIDRDPHWYTRRVKEAMHIRIRLTCGREVQTEKKIYVFENILIRVFRLHPHNINRDSGTEIPQAWISTIKNHKRKTVQRRTAAETASRQSNGTMEGSKCSSYPYRKVKKTHSRLTWVSLPGL